MIRRSFITCILLIKLALSGLAQGGYSNLEFIENRGQWDQRVRFKADISNGSFFLQKQGFTILLHNPDDVARLLESFHSHSNNQPATAANAVAVNKKIPAKGKDIPGSPGSSGSSKIIHSHAYQVSFLNANEKVEIIPDKALPGYNNYFIGNDHSKWASNCKVYQGITYKNIYPGIDVRYYTDESGTLKYDLIVHPGADPAQIAMKYTGADKLSIKNNQLITHTSVGDVKEMSPRSYQMSKTGRTEVDCRFAIDSGNTVRFKIKQYSTDATLVIDPSLVFSTLTASRSDNWGYTATYDASGNFYSGGIVLGSGAAGTATFPVSPGAYQTSYAGGNGSEGSSLAYDVAIMKFNTTGNQRVYATFLGGGGDEQPHSLVVDSRGNLVIAGRTSSGTGTTGFPVTSPTFGDGGGFDIFIAKLNANGTGLIGSRLFGGTLSDGVNIRPKYVDPQGTESLRRNYGDDGRSEVILDGADNIYLASCTQSTTISNSAKLFPVTAGAFQTSPGGAQDGVVIKTNPDLSNVLFSSFIGGGGNDAAFVLALNPTNNDIYVAGATASTTLPGTGNGPVLSTGLQGDIDGFVSIISNNGSTVKKTSFIGTSSTDLIYGVQFDKNGFPYVTGTTTNDNWPITPASVWSQPRGKQFIAKLRPDLSNWIYSTVFGKGDGAPDISPTAFLVDRCENVYVAGWGGGLDVGDQYENAGTTGLRTTSDAIQRNTDGADFYFFVLQKNAASQLYGSFFGQNGGLGDHVDGGTSRYDKQGIIYEAICANCSGGATFPTTPGVWSRTNGALPSGCNLAAVKIAFNFAGVGADVKAYINSVIDTFGCSTTDITFKDVVGNAKFWVWTFDTVNNPSQRDTTTSPSIIHQYPTKGVYIVRLIAVDSNTCNVMDTAYVTVRISDVHAFLKPDVGVIGDCRDLVYQFRNLTTLSPSHPNPPFSDTSFIWDFGDGTTLRYNGGDPPPHKYPSAGTYNASLSLNDSNYCNSPETISFTVNVAQFVKAVFTAPANACIGQPVSLVNNSAFGQQFFWDFGDGQTSSDFTPVHAYTDTGTYIIKLKVVDPTTCNGADSTQTAVSIHSTPVAAFTFAPVPPAPNTPTVFTNNSIGAVRYKWLFGDGDSVIKNNLDTVKHQYQRPGIFQACLIAYNQYDCTDTVCQPVEALINPLLDVPNAFTPGRFGQNSVIKVVGFGIATMTFRIYNRWGQKVFESNNPNLGWDGTFKGSPQPMDVYAYTLDAIYFDGSRTTKKGDITLIR